MTLDYNEIESERQDLEEEYDERMGTVYNALGNFFLEMDLAFPPNEESCHSIRIRILADAMKSCQSKMMQSIGRPTTSVERRILNIHMYSEKKN